MTGSSIEIKLEFTPNPMTLKYVFSQPLTVEGNTYFLSRKEAEDRSPMAVAIFAEETVAAVMLSSEFISVTYSDMNKMRDAHANVIQAIKTQLETGEPLCTDSDEDVVDQEDDAVVKRIKEVIEESIRPALARDGGDIRFIRFMDRVLFVSMMGACSGCPHAQMTLKNGVLQRVREEVPEVVDIVSI